MEKELVSIDRLMEILGYTDERSLAKWCKQNHVPLLKMGLKKYTLSHYLTQLIENQLVIFAKANSLNPDAILQMAKKIEKEAPVNVASNNGKGKSSSTHSKATLKFLQNIKAT